MLVRVGVLTVSDRCARDEAIDKSGPALVEMVRARLGATIVQTACVPDEIEAIRSVVNQWAEPSSGIDLILTCGGTGLAPRDVTPEAVRGLLEREAPGLCELARRTGGDSTPHAYLSRGVAGTIGKTLVITLPGSVQGASQSLEALLEILPHAIEQIRGDDLAPHP